jgi:hypothetical protein
MRAVVFGTLVASEDSSGAHEWLAVSTLVRSTSNVHEALAVLTHSGPGDAKARRILVTSPPERFLTRRMHPLSAIAFHAHSGNTLET